MSSAVALSLIGVILGLLIAMVLTYKGWTVLLVSPIAAVVIFLFGGLNPLTEMFSTYTTGIANMYKNMFLLYMSCFIFAEIMSLTKSCYTMGYWLNKIFGPERATTSLIIFAIILRFGGLNVGVYMVIYIMGLYMFKQANYSEDMLLGITVAGTWTFCNSMPFFPGNHNILVQQTLGTPKSAGLSMGLVHGIIEAVIIVAIFEIVSKKWRKKGRVFTADQYLPSGDELDPKTFPPIWKAVLPIILFVVLYQIFNVNVSACMIFAAILCSVLNLDKMNLVSWFHEMEKGAKNSLMSCACVCVMGGIAAAITATPFYEFVLNWMTTVPIHPYILTYFASALIGLMFASAMTAVTTCLPMFQPLFEMWSQTMGLDMGVFHRLMVCGAVAFNTWPHNGVVSGIVEMYHTTYKKSLPLAMFAGTLVPIVVTTAVVLPMALMGFH